MNKIVVAVTGASAQQLAERSIQLLLNNGIDVSLVLSKGAYEVWASEIGIKIPLDSSKQEEFWRTRLSINNGNLNCYKWNENSAPFASGSFKTDGMVIIPCTMGTIGRIASGISRDLIERAADVHLKERRKLIISPRESPYNLIHLKNMTALTEAGAQIIPCIPSWYSKPSSLEEMIDFMLVRLFDSLDLDLLEVNRWNGKSHE